MIDYFRDFDNLRRGYCTVGQAQTVFGICGLLGKIAQKDLEELKIMYSVKDLNLTNFNYAKFCEDVDGASRDANIHLDPLARTEMPPPEATMPARRDRVIMSEKDKAEIEEIE